MVDVLMPDAIPPADSNDSKSPHDVENVTASPRFAPPLPEPEDEFHGGKPIRSAQPREEDLRHLQLLSIFHFVVGAMAMLCATFPIIHFTVGLGLVTGKLGSGGTAPPPPPAIGWMFVLFSGGAIVIGYGFAIGLFVAGWMLRRRKGYVFCLVMAGLACMFQPAGVVLGVFTIIVLIRPSVKALFGRPTAKAG